MTTSLCASRPISSPTPQSLPSTTRSSNTYSQRSRSAAAAAIEASTSAYSPPRRVIYRSQLQLEEKKEKPRTQLELDLARAISSLSIRPLARLPQIPDLAALNEDALNGAITDLLCHPEIQGDIGKFQPGEKQQLSIHGHKVSRICLCSLPTTAQKIEAIVLHFPNLKILCAHDSGIDDACIRALAPLRRLEVLDLQRTQVTDASIEAFIHLSSLQNIDLEGCQKINSITMHSLAFRHTVKIINKKPILEFVLKLVSVAAKGEDLNRDLEITLRLLGENQNLAPLFPAIKALLVAMYERLPKGDDAPMRAYIIQELLRHKCLFTFHLHPALLRAFLNPNPKLYLGASEGLRKLLSEVDPLKTIGQIIERFIFSDVPLFTLNGLEKIFTYFPNIHELDFQKNTAMAKILLSAEGIALLKTLPHLVFINLSNYSEIDNNILDLLVRQLPNLERLDLINTNIDDASLRIIAKLPRLQHVDINNCRKITATGVIYTLTQHQSLKMLKGAQDLIQNFLKNG